MMMLRSNSVGHELVRKAGDSLEIQETQSELRVRIIKLYTSIVKFQIQAACSLCRSAANQGFRDTVKIDDWKGILDPIIQCEKNCWDLINKVNADRSKHRSDKQVRICRMRAGFLLIEIKDLSEQNRELDRLPVTAASFNDDLISQGKSECLPNTRVQLLKEIMEWSVNRQGEHILWLNGRAGTGKSTVAMTVCRQLSNEGRLGANFFFSRQQNQGHSRNFFTTLARHLANLSPEFRERVSNAIAHHHDFVQKAFEEQWQWLLLDPLKTCQSSWAPIVIVIDALDECDSERAAQDILALLTEYKDAGQLPLRILVTSRPEVLGFNHCESIRRVDIHETQDTEKDISLFLEHELSEIREERRAAADWPGKTKIELLAQKAGNLFIYAATACRFIDVSFYYDEHLNEILKNDATGLAELHNIYTKILETAAFHDVPETKKKESQTKLNDIIAAAVALFSPLSISGLSEFLPCPVAKLNAYLGKLGSVIAISDGDLQVRISHLSFRDFFLDVKSEDKRFCASEPEVHRNLLDRCLKIMSAALKMDTCNIRQLDYLPNSNDQKRLPEHVQYACRYWVRHFERSDGLQHETVLNFLEEHLLHWLEALSLLGQVSEGVLMITALYNMPNVRDSATLYSFDY
jgi:archaellum biogenesis ATPase FlaH